MNVYAEALVHALLEDELTVKVRQRQVEATVPAVILDPPDRWTSLIGEGHGMQRLYQRIEANFRIDFLEMLRGLKTAKVLVPARGKWALKMPNGYAVFGTGSQGISVTTRLDKIADDQQLVDNPLMDPVQNRRWEQARKSL